MTELRARFPNHLCSVRCCGNSGRERGSGPGRRARGGGGAVCSPVRASRRPTGGSASSRSPWLLPGGGGGARGSTLSTAACSSPKWGEPSGRSSWSRALRGVGHSRSVHPGSCCASGGFARTSPSCSSFRSAARHRRALSSRRSASSRCRAPRRTASTNGPGSGAAACTWSCAWTAGRPWGGEAGSAELQIGSGRGSRAPLLPGSTAIDARCSKESCSATTRTFRSSLRNRFRASGLYHLLAVSGQNVALVAASALWVAWLAGLPRLLGEFGSARAEWPRTCSRSVHSRP